MSISAQQVKELRDKSGAGMMECKKALGETGGDIEAALDWLRKQGLKALSNKASRVAADGMVTFNLSADQQLGTLIEINCETDFVAKNEDFVALANKIAKLVSDKNPASPEELLGLTVEGSETVNDRLNLLTAKIGEKLSFRRFVRLTAAGNQKIGAYIHLGSKIGVLVKLEGNNANADVVKDVAMHIAAANPLYLNKDEIPASVIEREKDVYREQMKDSGKPAQILEKIIEGKVSKFSTEVCLNDQVFIKDPTGKKTVAQHLKETDPSLKVVQFIRFQVGEGLEKKVDDFAAEVSKMAK